MTARYELILADHLAWYDHSLLLPVGRGARGRLQILNVMRRWRYSRRLRSVGNRTAFGPRTLALEEEAVRESSDQFDFRVPWREIELVGATPEHLFIAHRSMNAHIVPLRCFASAAAREEFVALAHRRLAAVV